MFKDLVETDFRREVLENSEKPAMVFIHTDWCSNCRRQLEVFSSADDSHKEIASYYKINAEQERGLVRSLRVMGVPTLLIYSHGVLIKKYVGVVSLSKLKRNLTDISKYSKDEAEKHEFRSMFSRLFSK